MGDLTPALRPFRVASSVPRRFHGCVRLEIALARPILNRTAGRGHAPERASTED
jgi:hypothetical protein